MLEKRHERRRKEKGRISLLRDGVQFLTGETQDISRSGVLLIADSDAGLKPGDTVEVDLTYAHGIAAKVVRIVSARDGVGIALRFNTKAPV